MTHPVDIVLPALNEERAIPWVLQRVPDGYRAIVVDNGSTDNTAEIARSLGALVVHQPIKGFGAACWAGLLATESDIVCFMDCDGSMDPSHLPELVAAVESSTTDLALGARKPERGAWSIHARFANWALARMISKRIQTKLTDLGPMRAMKRSYLFQLDLSDRRSGWPLEMVLKAHAIKLSITEFDVPYYRREGKSKVTGTVLGTLRAIKDMRSQLKEFDRKIKSTS